jgi:hypothetical protein
MYIARVDMMVLKTKEVHDLLDEYEARFGKRFLPFNYDNFHRVDEKCAAQMYKEALAKALGK